MEQNQWNEDLKERFRIQVKTLQAHKADAQIEIDKILSGHGVLTKRIDEANAEFAKVFDVVNSMVELQYLSQLMELQDEVDRHATSLWALQPE